MLLCHLIDKRTSYPVGNDYKNVSNLTGSQIRNEVSRFFNYLYNPKNSLSFG